MLSNLQVLRGIAALGVVFFHTEYRLMGDWHTEFFGVAIFFVISGFIMCFITRDGTGAGAGADDFLTKRLVRIVPFYWLCTLAVLVVMFGAAIVDPATWLAPLDGRPLVEPLWAYVGRSLSFSPLDDIYPVLNVGWSLNYEMYFYFLFALALWISRRFAPLLVVLALVGANAAYAACTAAACHYLSFAHTQFFVAGIAVFYVARLFVPAGPRPVVVVLGLGLVALCYGSQFVGPWWADTMPASAYLALATAAPIVIVAAALFAERAGGAVTWRPLILLGDASYALYLTHPIVFEALRQAGLPAAKDSAAVLGVYLVLATAAGVLAHLYVEMPLLRAIRRRQAPPAIVTAGLSRPSGSRWKSGGHCSSSPAAPPLQ